MLNLSDCIKYSPEHLTYIRGLGVPEYKDWDSKKKVNKEIKKEIRKQLLTFQKDKCVYCRLKLGETSRDEIEHIAPRHNYPQFEYTVENLAISCQHCNSSSKKGRKDTIGTYNTYYNNCTFTIIHPYLDDVDYFLESDGAIIRIRSGLAEDERVKAKNTLDMFKLSDRVQVEAREKDLIYEEWKQKHTVDDAKLLESISTYV